MKKDESLYIKPTMKYILLDAETNDHLDTFFEKRNWANVVKQVEPIGQDVTIVWVRRTPEEKGERPYTYKREYLESISLEDYAKWKYNITKYMMAQSTHNANAYEFYKGQFLILRELLEPKYRINPQSVDFQLDGLEKEGKLKSKLIKFDSSSTRVYWNSSFDGEPIGG